MKLKNFTQEKKTEGKTKNHTIIKIIFAVFCFLLLCELVVFKYVMPSMSSPKLTISGQKVYSAEEIAKKLNLYRKLTTYEEEDIVKWTENYGYSMDVIEIALKKASLYK